MLIKKHSNQGFSLIEMVVAVLVAGVLMIGVAAFISTSRVTYSKVSTEARLQEEATATTNFLNEILIESKRCGCQEIKDTSTGKDLKYIWVKALENDPASAADIRVEYVYFIVFEKPASGETSGVLRYKKVPASSTDIMISIDASTGEDIMTLAGTTESGGVSTTDYFEDVVGNKYAFISRNVTDMTFNSIKSQNGNLYKVNLSFNYNGQDFSATVNNLSRNPAITPTPIPTETESA